jgi:RNA polymerase sigma-70 factor (ECF subfamily)
MELSDDETLLDLLATDLNKYYELLWQKYGENLYVYIYRHMNNLQDTNDVTQDTALRVYNALNGYSEEKIRSMSPWLRPWLYKVAKSACLTYIEKQKRSVSSVSWNIAEEALRHEQSNDDRDQPEAIIERQETRHRLEALVAKLPAKYREVIYLHYFDGFKLHEIADILQEPAGTVRQKERRALLLLHDLHNSIVKTSYEV